jgi:hypothetical protein
MSKQTNQKDAVATVRHTDHNSQFSASADLPKGRFRLTTQHALTGIVCAFLIGAAVLVTAVKPESSISNTRGNVSTGSGSVSDDHSRSSVLADRSHNVVTAKGDAVRKEIRSVVNGGENVRTYTAESITAISADEKELARQAWETADYDAIDDIVTDPELRGWRTDRNGIRYIPLRFTIHRKTKITQHFDPSPFAGRDRRVVVELRNVRPESIGRFAFHVKTIRKWADSDRQVDNNLDPAAGQEFLVERNREGDMGLYLAWRGQGTREEFERDNPNALLIVRLLD